MTEVTLENFDDLFPQIVDEINKCSFISFKLYSTGEELISSNTNKIIKSPEDAFDTLRHSVIQQIPCQLGLALFHESSNEFRCCTYNFHLLPRFYNEKNSRKFQADVSTLEFLSARAVDFNKLFGLGISFMNEFEEAQLRQSLAQSCFKVPPLRSHATVLDELIKKIVHWISFSIILPNSQEALYTRLLFTPFVNDIHNYLIIRSLRNCFADLWVDLDPALQDNLLVRRVSADERAQLEQDTQKFENEILIANLVGFSRLFKSLLDSKKPLVGIDMLSSVMFMYQHFYQDLPDTLNHFQANVVNTFPCMYDISRIYEQVKRTHLPNVPQFFTTYQLNQLYEVIQSKGFCSHLNMNPQIVCMQIEEGDDVLYENCGYEAFRLGTCFIKLTHLLVVKSYSESQNNKSFHFSDCIKIVDNVSNQLQIFRGLWVDLRSTPKIQEKVTDFLLTSHIDLQLDQVRALCSPFDNIKFTQINSKQVKITTKNEAITCQLIAYLNRQPTYQVQILSNNELTSNFKKSIVITGTVSFVSFAFYYFIRLIMRKN